MTQVPRSSSSEPDSLAAGTGAPAAGQAVGSESGGTSVPFASDSSAAEVDRVAELEAALAAAKAEAAQNWDRYLRERAEMENYKRRIERTYADLAKQGRKTLLSRVVAALDNLDRALSYQAASGEEVDTQSLLTGLRMTYQQFEELLAAEGVKPIEAVGVQFDPSLHDAVATAAVDDMPDGQIVDELQKGYTYQDELLRPARVRVATRGQ
jgi:molecular chaperone GrpE